MFKTIKCLPSDPHPQRCKQAVELALGLKSIYFNSNLCYFFDKMYSELFCVYCFLLLCKRFCLLCFVRENGLQSQTLNKRIPSFRFYMRDVMSRDVMTQLEFAFRMLRCGHRERSPALCAGLFTFSIWIKKNFVFPHI